MESDINAANKKIASLSNKIKILKKNYYDDVSAVKHFRQNELDCAYAEIKNLKEFLNIYISMRKTLISQLKSLDEQNAYLRNEINNLINDE